MKKIMAIVLWFITINNVYSTEKYFSGFRYLRTKTYSCGGQTHSIREYLHINTGMEFALLPGNKFIMGYRGNSPRHEVKLTSFLISKTEVTQQVWKKIMKNTPWKNQRWVKNGNNYPAIYLTWEEADLFCNKMGLQLPTEAQWEYACRAGTQTLYYWGNEMNETYAWNRKNTWDKGEKYPHKVAQKKPNAFGLYDMAGNAYEWCYDWYDKNYYKYSPLVNPKGPKKGVFRVVRGSNFCQQNRLYYSFSRLYCKPNDDRKNKLGVGFRPVFVLRINKNWN